MTTSDPGNLFKQYAVQDSQVGAFPFVRPVMIFCLERTTSIWRGTCVQALQLQNSGIRSYNFWGTQHLDIVDKLYKSSHITT